MEAATGKTLIFRVYGMAFGPRRRSFTPDHVNFDAMAAGFMGGFRTDWQLILAIPSLFRATCTRVFTRERAQVSFYIATLRADAHEPHNVAAGNLLGVWHHEDQPGLDFQLPELLRPHIKA